MPVICQKKCFCLLYFSSVISTFLKLLKRMKAPPKANFNSYKPILFDFTFCHGTMYLVSSIRCYHFQWISSAPLTNNDNGSFTSVGNGWTFTFSHTKKNEREKHSIFANINLSFWPYLFGLRRFRLEILKITKSRNKSRKTSAHKKKTI